MIRSVIEHLNWSLLCSLNPGISPIFESAYFASRELLFPQLLINLCFTSSAITCLRFELESTRLKSLDDNPTPLYYSGSSCFINFVLNSSAFSGFALHHNNSANLSDYQKWRRCRGFIPSVYSSFLTKLVIAHPISCCVLHKALRVPLFVCRSLLPKLLPRYRRLCERIWVVPNRH